MSQTVDLYRLKLHLSMVCDLGFKNQSDQMACVLQQMQIQPVQKHEH